MEADLVSGEVLVLRLLLAVSSCDVKVEGDFWVSFIKILIPFPQDLVTPKRSHLQLPSDWVLGFNL